jgi:hypothetical protein
MASFSVDITDIKFETYYKAIAKFRKKYYIKKLIRKGCKNIQEVDLDELYEAKSRIGKLETYGELKAHPSPIICIEDNHIPFV